MIDQKFHAVLDVLYPLLQMEPVPVWVITGSMGFALQGMDVEVHDVDIQSDEPGAYEIERRCSAWSIRRVAFAESDRIRSHFGALEVGGVKVEIMGGVQKRLPDGRWEEPVDITRFRRWTVWEGMRLPVLSLEYESRAYRILGRIKKAEMIEEWLRGHGDSLPS
jgi:hypothetical protein